MTPTLKIDTTKSIKKLDNLFGIFFEDINHAVDGGLYSELLRNGSFEFSPLDNPTYTNTTAWEKVKAGADIKTLVRSGTPPFPQNPHYLQLQVIGTSGSAGVSNAGFHNGFPVDKTTDYQFSCYARCHDDFSGHLSVSLESQDKIESQGKAESQNKAVIAHAQLPNLTKKWQKLEIKLTPQAASASTKLLLMIHGEGFVDIDIVSLKPIHSDHIPTGFRKDIATLLADLKPKFMRFPGGCLVADGSPDATSRQSLYRWKNTISPLETRPSRRNSWGYNQSLGIGFYEYFLFSKLIGAEPVPVLPVCAINGHATPMDELQELIDDAIDLISFANDDITTTWGAKRAEMGHPQPFNMKYLALGNEEVGEPYFKLYPYFHNAIKAKYPDIQLVNSASPFAAGTEYDRGWASANEHNSELVDEHYYQSPEWFLANMDRYDSFDPQGPKVFLGEYASWGNTYYNALVEAAFMTHLEKAPAVAMACYAPLLCNADYVNWRPDLIWYNQAIAYGTANYYVQKLFMNHQGTDELSATLTNISTNTPAALSDAADLCNAASSQDAAASCNAASSRDEAPPCNAASSQYAAAPCETAPADKPISGEIALDSRRGTCILTDIQLTNDDTGEISKQDNQTVTAKGLHPLFATIDATNYTLRFKATKTEVTEDHAHPGSLSFYCHFGHKDPQNTFVWELGGWANNDSIVRRNINGRGSCLHQTVFSVELGQEYDCKLEVKGRQITTWINGRQMNVAIDKLPIIQPLYYAASKDSESGDIIIKAVNVNDADITIGINLEANPDPNLDANRMTGSNSTAQDDSTAKQGGFSGKLHCLSGYPLDAANSFDSPHKVSPTSVPVSYDTGIFTQCFKARSVNVLRLHHQVHE